MGIVEQYLVSAAFPSTVGGTGTSLKYFASNPPQSLWNSGVSGVNSPISSAQLGATPSSTNALGQLSFDSVAFKLQGTRFRMYASGEATSDTTPTITPTVQINTGTIASPSYTSLAAVASNALVANKTVAWSIELKLIFGPTSGTLGGWFNYMYNNQAGGGTDKNATDAIITTVTGLTGGSLYATEFGFVVGITFGTSSAANTASLYQFALTQD